MALQIALSRANLAVADIDLLISASAIPEQALPYTASRIAGAMDMASVASFDVNASCVSFVVALHLAATLLGGGSFRRVAIVSSELASRGIDWDDPETRSLFGDGAAATIVERGDGSTGILSYRLETWPEGNEYCEIRAGGTRLTPRTGATPADSLFRMDGKRVFRLASKTVPSFLNQLLPAAGMKPRDVDILIPHQASRLGMQHMLRRIPLRPQAHVIDVYDKYGNQVAASLPTALHEAHEEGLLKPGKRVLMLGTAAGFTIAGMVLTT
ncbi:ketoacyl-ACP synthase III [Stenotrophomonas rhizophila]|uniref:3-oxoacyl-ACP synthase III family protein n=1 Tax=Stenotrophomonas TaxID=40323 RepID=UPI001C12A333|nr:MULTISPECIES: ketoacyl-ACP synthase III [Stenotrophomonas]MCX2920138.1 ketoacyl-ACP synthase III [Stenotrophomonas rhizophila]